MGGFEAFLDFLIQNTVIYVTHFVHAADKLMAG